MLKKKEDRIYVLLIIMFSLAILFYYARNISGVRDLHELPDSFGYLADAAYLSGTDWVNATQLYYGYGYSLWLVPLFWLYDTGLEIIHRALLINVVFIVGIFLALAWILRRFFPENNKIVHLIIAGALCLYPYLMKASLTVWCESLLPLVVLLCAIFAYQAIETQKTVYFILLGVTASYTFFVHARSVVFLAVFLGLFVIACLINKISMRRIVVFIVAWMIAFAMGYLVKYVLIQEVYNSELSSYLLNDSSIDESVGNLLTVSRIVGRFETALKDLFIESVYSFFCKIFYLFASTAGMFWVGIVYGIRSLVQSIKRKRGVSGKTFVVSGFAIAALVMLFAVTVNCSNNESRATYCYYGRYYEFLVFLPTAIGAASLVGQRKKVWEYLSVGILTVCSFLFAYNLQNVARTETIVFDTNRLVAFSYGFFGEKSYQEIITFYFVAALIGFCISIVLNKNKYASYLISLVLLISPMINNRTIADALIGNDAQASYEQEVAEYIWTYNPDTTVYYLNSEETYYSAVYADLQGILGTKELHVIADRDAELIEKGSLVIAPWGNILEEKRSDTILLLRTNRYYLYYIIK